MSWCRARPAQSSAVNPVTGHAVVMSGPMSGNPYLMLVVVMLAGEGGGRAEDEKCANQR